MKKTIRLTESDLIKLVKKIINEETDLGKFNDYAQEKLLKKGFTKVDDKTFESKKNANFIKIKYKYFPEYEIGGFEALVGGRRYYEGPADECWAWLDKHFN